VTPGHTCSDDGRGTGRGALTTKAGDHVSDGEGGDAKTWEERKHKGEQKERTETGSRRKAATFHGKFGGGGICLGNG